jgi:hypothetical protein
MGVPTDSGALSSGSRPLPVQLPEEIGQRQSEPGQNYASIEGLRLVEQNRAIGSVKDGDGPRPVVDLPDEPDPGGFGL